MAGVSTDRPPRTTESGTPFDPVSGPEALAGFAPPAALARPPPARYLFRLAVRPGVRAGGAGRLPLGCGARPAGEVPVHPRHLSGPVHPAAVVAAPERRVRHRDRVERPLPGVDRQRHYRV